MKDIVADTKLIAYCGLYCGACRKYLKEQCPGCQKNEKASWCKVRACGMEHQYATCADCQIIGNLADCKKFNNVIAKVFGLIFRSDRAACIQFIKAKGADNYAAYMAQNRIMTIRK